MVLLGAEIEQRIKSLVILHPLRLGLCDRLSENFQTVAATELAAFYLQYY